MARPTDRPPQESPQPPSSPFLPPGPQAPRPQLPPAEPRLQQRGVAAQILAMLSLLAMLFIGNWQRAAAVAAVALAVGVIAMTLALTAMSAARRAATRRPRDTTVGLVLGAIGVLFSGLLLLACLVFGPQLTQYANCTKAANTIAGQQSCETQLQNSMESRIRAIGGR